MRFDTPPRTLAGYPLPPAVERLAQADADAAASALLARQAMLDARLTAKHAATSLDGYIKGRARHDVLAATFMRSVAVACARSTSMHAQAAHDRAQEAAAYAIDGQDAYDAIGLEDVARMGPLRPYKVLETIRESAAKAAAAEADAHSSAMQAAACSSGCHSDDPTDGGGR